MGLGRVVVLSFWYFASYAPVFFQLGWCHDKLSDGNEWGKEKKKVFTFLMTMVTVDYHFAFMGFIRSGFPGSTTKLVSTHTSVKPIQFLEPRPTKNRGD